MNESDCPAVLAHAENESAKNGNEWCGIESPLINRHAVDDLLRRIHQMQNFMLLYMSEEPLGNFKKYIVYSLAFLL